MASQGTGVHTLGPTCAYHEDEGDTILTDNTGLPPVKSQFFYVSSLPIDDPLSPLPPIPADRPTKQPPQPFSARDHAALEEAWQGSQKAHGLGKNTKSRPTLKGMFSFPKFKKGIKSPAMLSPTGELSLVSLSGDLQKAFSGLTRGEYNKRPRPSATNPDIRQDKLSTDEPALKDFAEHTANVTNTLGHAGASRPDQESHRRGNSKASDHTSTAESQVMLSQSPPDKVSDSSPIDAEELRREESKNDPSAPSKRRHHRHLSPFRRKSYGEDSHETSSRDFAPSTTASSEQVSAQAVSSDISGRPFARAPSQKNITGATTDGARDVLSDASDDTQTRSRDRSRERSGKSKKRDGSSERGRVYVPVGVARLHLVELPDLVMKPIYWNPINDTSDVVRATWFYKDTMLPVPVDVANRLEIGYEYIRPYSDTYQYELQACIENGASAELKIVHKLWPAEKKASRPNTGDLKLEADSEEEDEAAFPEAYLNIAMDPNKKASKRLFGTHSVIYIDRKNAQILKPNLLPSVPQNRRPLSSVRKGRPIGIAVVRGFDRNAWSRLHPAGKMNARSAHAQIGAYMSQSGDATTRGRRTSCTTCEDESRTPHVSDLVLVIHGIGQKLSERVDSFHFTHAINGLRREFNVEMSSEAVKGNLKPDSGIMVLPVNWRLTVSFDDDLKTVEDQADSNRFALGDITPETLPAVRSIISDVMLDIPYYLSHHKNKMTAAVIREANRVYRLWCRNNPGFQEHGRVHLVAHSLGSVMAMEILSKQPTRVPKDLKFDKPDPSETMFEFDTTNLFCCGSPAGFFLLLNNACLIPRKSRDKPGMEGEDHGAGIAAEEGYGCLAIDNLYNICHRNDPVAYLINAAVDSDYAASLQPANIPNATASLFSRLWSSPLFDAYAAKNMPTRPNMQSMPSTVEMDTHNFTREEIAEKRMYLLNENGQLDFMLASGGGPLEIQYLSMLSAHSSYWLSQDFVRFLVVEIGRKPGRKNTIEVLRARKKRKFKRGEMK